jgi:hypothetical protein
MSTEARAAEPALERALNARLEAVLYACVPGELSSSWHEVKQLVTAFGPVLSFRNGVHVHLTWDQTGGPPPNDPVTYHLAAESKVPPTCPSLVLIDAGSSEIWARHIGNTLVAYRGVGQGKRLYAVELVFPSGSVIVVNGLPESLGETDDILTSGEPLALPPGWLPYRRGGAV